LRISPTLLFSIIIVAAIAAGLAIYDMKTGNLSKSFYEKAQEMDPIIVTFALLDIPFPNQYSLCIHVQNMRNATIVSLTAELEGEEVLNFKDLKRQYISEENPLAPYGRAYVAAFLRGVYEAGKSYNVTIRAVYANGTTYAKTIKLSCIS